MTDLLFQTGTLVRCPGGNVETVPEQVAAGVKWAALNVGTDPCVRRDPSVWAKLRGMYAAAGVPVGPWMHCRSIDDVDWLVGVAVDWQAAFVGVNVEDVVGDELSLGILGKYLQDFWVRPYGKPVHMPTLPWVQNGQGWQYVDFCYLALEMFPEEGGQPYLDGYQRCIDHAFAEGAKRVTLLYSTKSPRSVYPNVAHCLYTADNVTNWPEWHDSVTQEIPLPPTPTPPPEVPMLTVKQFPYTGPCYGPPHPNQTMNYSTVKGLKRAMIRLGYLNQALGSETDDYGAELKAAIKKFQKSESLFVDGHYKRGDYAELRSRKLTSGPNAGQYALDALALKYIREDLVTLCYPHPDVDGVYVGQGPHVTTGIPGNVAIDFMAFGGTPVLAVERARITRFSGHDPKQWPSDDAGIWGWSIYYETASGYRYFSTHYGTRTCKVGQIVEVGDVIGTVGRWPGDPGRSHTHLGCSSVKGYADAKKHIEAIAAAPKLPEL